MSNKSRRRLSLATGAILAGAVFPIAAAANVWADDETETFSQLVGQGLASATAPTVSALGPDLDSNLIDLGAHLLTGVDPFTAGLDATSVFDPSVFADVLTSIGF